MSLELQFPLICIKDLLKLGLVSTVSMYTDDTGLSLQSTDTSQLNIAGNNDHRFLNTWGCWATSFH